ncbi:MAG: NUDIX domain-containing protein [Candidatus Lokiarchaeota archaeon]|nr:NUDIX domain-containing protein [Candidatus Lokiarchaeota archaeon]
MSWRDVRPVAICLFYHNEKILVFKGYDKGKDEIFYRPIGGSIEFGEYGEQAVRREIREEIQAEIKDIKFLTMFENIFTYEGKIAHEIVLVFDGTLVDSSLYEKTLIVQEDDENQTKYDAYWKSLYEIKQENRPLYPDGLYNFIEKNLIKKKKVYKKN